jgi:Flp pilus assembly protein TadD
MDNYLRLIEISYNFWKRRNNKRDASSPGRAVNDEGVGHYKQGHWDVATDWFKKAVKADANLAEAHYNLALSLDKMGKHEEATAAFKKAAELAPSNPAIKDSTILKKHLGI